MIKLLPLELSDALMQHAACSPAPPRSFPWLPLISWPSPTSFSFFHPSSSSFSLSSPPFYFYPLLFSAFPSNIPCHLPLFSSLSSKVCLPLPQFVPSLQLPLLSASPVATQVGPGQSRQAQLEIPGFSSDRQTQPNPNSCQPLGSCLCSEDATISRYAPGC